MHLLSGCAVGLSYRSGSTVKDRIYFDYDSVIGIVRFIDPKKDLVGHCQSKIHPVTRLGYPAFSTEQQAPICSSCELNISALKIALGSNYDRSRPGKTVEHQPVFLRAVFDRIADQGERLYRRVKREEFLPAGSGTIEPLVGPDVGSVPRKMKVVS